MDRINIVAACDEKFIQHLGVMLSSLLHANPGEPFRFFVLTSAPHAALGGVLKVAAGHDCIVEPIAFDATPYTSLPSVAHLSHATYFRLAIPAALPPEIRRVIYLDCDVVVTKSIRKLWELELDQAIVGAASDVQSSYNLAKLKLPPGSPYFNAGILLIDLERWRAGDISRIALDVLRHEFERVTWADQCALNIALHGKWKSIPSRWNLITQLIGRMTGSEIELYPNARSLLDDAAIIHFSTHSKPWHYANQHPAKHLYWDEIKRTPWRGARPTGRAGYIARKILGDDSPLFRISSWLGRR